MEGYAKQAYESDRSGVELGDRRAFDANSKVLRQWLKQERTPFAAAPTRPSKKRMSVPYFLPDTEGS